MKSYRYTFTLKNGSVYSTQPHTSEKDAYKSLFDGGIMFPESAIRVVTKDPLFQTKGE